jgi:uncharacterized protein (TIGR03437 family)
LTLTALNIPPGAQFDSATGTFSWEPGNARAGSYSIEFRATNSIGESAAATTVVDVVSGNPVLREVVHSATSLTESACSPGALATVKGVALTRATAPESVRLSINGEPVTVVYGSPKEITFVCPDVAPGSSLHLQAQRGDLASNVLEIVMAEAAPGIFSLDGSGHGQAVAVLGGTDQILMVRSPEMPSQPAMPADTIAITATGLGKDVTPDRLEVRIGAAAATPESVNAAVPGVWQVWVRIPETAFPGDAVTLRLSLMLPDGRTVESNEVIIAIETGGDQDR